MWHCGCFFFLYLLHQSKSIMAFANTPEARPKHYFVLWYSVPCRHGLLLSEERKQNENQDARVFVRLSVCHACG